MSRLNYLTIYCLVLFFGIFVLHQYNELHANDADDLALKFRSSTEKVRIDAYQQFKRNNESHVDILIQIINEPVSKPQEWMNDTTPENLAINALGELRSTKAIPSLLEWITPPEGGFIVGRNKPLHQSPAGRALVNIGKPSVPYLIDLLAGDPKDKVWQISLDILKEIEGEKALKVILIEAASQEQDVDKRRNIQLAIKKI